MSLILDGLSKKFDQTLAVNDLSITLSNGVYGLLGANGAGKTTLMRMICGVLKPSQGSISYDGLDVKTENYRDLLGYLPQDFGYYPNFTAQKFLLYMASLKGLTPYQSRKKSKELLALVNLTHVAKKKIKTFSGGMLQRLGIAQALINTPKILILDEPTAGLDPKERVRFRNLIADLGQDRIVLLSTHIVSDVEYIADTILFMKEGKIITQGPASTVHKVLEDKVYQCQCSHDQALVLRDTYPILNFRKGKDKTMVRLVSDVKPHAHAQGVPATLEDLYLFYFKEVDQNDNSH